MFANVITIIVNSKFKISNSDFAVVNIRRVSEKFTYVNRLNKSFTYAC